MGCAGRWRWPELSQYVRCVKGRSEGLIRNENVSWRRDSASGKLLASILLVNNRWIYSILGSNMRTLVAVIASVVGLGIGVSAAGAATQGDGPYIDQPDLAGTPVQVGETVYGKFLASRHAESVGDFAAAATFASQLLAEDVDLQDIAQRGHLLMATAGRIAEAAELAERVVAENEGDPLANMTLVTRAFEREDYREALTRLNKIQLTGIQRIIAPLMRAWALAGDGRTEAALDVLDELTGTNGMGPITGLHAGLIADLSDRSELADAAYRRGIDASGETPALQLVEAYARFLTRNDRRDEAVRLVEAFTHANPRTLLIEPAREALADGEAPDPVVSSFADGAAESLHAVANLLNRERLRAQSLIMIRLALHLRPDSPSTLFLLGQVLEREEQTELAMEAYDAIDPATSYGWYARLNLADGHRAQDDMDAGLRLLRAMVRERPERTDAARALGDFLRIDERYREAVTAYDTAFERSSDDVDWQLYYTRGIALERAKLWDRAESDFLKALELEPDQPLVLNYLGYSWIEQKQNLERAKQMIEKAVLQRPQDGFIADSLGWAMYRLGNYTEAVTHLERAVALEPGDPVINDHLGDAYWLADRRDEARFQWIRSLSQEPDPEVEAIVRDKLDGKQLPIPLPADQRRDI
ncbi:MAG: tetratricopeptide repeat protein [Alphaproteobacteria bacterium]|nr:tetratricopeptide repeat protein [Alphaproteobacteria bacterium]